VVEQKGNEGDEDGRKNRRRLHCRAIMLDASLLLPRSVVISADIRRTSNRTKAIQNWTSV
jgi:hypothetical protein